MDNAVELMRAYLENRATENERKRLEEYVSASEKNRYEYLRFKNLWEASHAPFKEEDIDVGKAKRKMLAEIGAARKPFGKRFLGVWKSVAAILLIPLLGVSAYLVHAVRTAGERQPAELSVSAPYGSIVRTKLSDGTAICLNSGSRLTYTDSWPQGKRVVGLEGEAWFEVTSDKNNPFTVKLGDGSEVTATGTSFNIDAYDTERLRVTLVEGRLDIACGDGRHQLGQGCQLIRDGESVRTEQVSDVFKWISWKDDILAFRGDDMRYVFDRLSNIFSVCIEVHDRRILDMKLRATFSDEKIEDIMSLLEQVLPIRCERAGGDSTNGERKKFIISSK